MEITIVASIEELEEMITKADKEIKGGAESSLIDMGENPDLTFQLYRKNSVNREQQTHFNAQDLEKEFPEE